MMVMSGRDQSEGLRERYCRTDEAGDNKSMSPLQRTACFLQSKDADPSWLTAGTVDDVVSRYRDAVSTVE